MICGLAYAQAALVYVPKKEVFLSLVLWTGFRIQLLIRR